ncbi:MAG: hypothetical protein ACD_78C00009G0001 [uncultured bacterium (gcode 4)]|uniref:Uncharacterized protein n=1 Tax=uncultured bacterium (gcode 4) TaxID=1234023 RepID=K1Y050_9BACT|nr:MAG: hypothetical protein ACD_78C00009G0001 [uncultured bacterium (gcode 4)]
MMISFGKFDGVSKKRETWSKMICIFRYFSYSTGHSWPDSIDFTKIIKIWLFVLVVNFSFVLVVQWIEQGTPKA